MTSNRLAVIPLGGATEIGKNLTVYRLGEQLLVVDCGLMFPTDEMLGVDVAIAAHYLSPTPAVDEFLSRVHERDSSGRRQALAPAVGQWIAVEARTSGVVAVIEEH